MSLDTEPLEALLLGRGGNGKVGTDGIELRDAIKDEEQGEQHGQYHQPNRPLLLEGSVQHRLATYCPSVPSGGPQVPASTSKAS